MCVRVCDEIVCVRARVCACASACSGARVVVCGNDGAFLEITFVFFDGKKDCAPFSNDACTFDYMYFVRSIEKSFRPDLAIYKTRLFVRSFTWALCAGKFATAARRTSI